MRTLKTRLSPGLAFLGVAVLASCAAPQDTNKPKMATKMPAGITAPAEVKTRHGTLRTKDGFPDKATIEKVYDNLDFQRGVTNELRPTPDLMDNNYRRGR